MLFNMMRTSVWIVKQKYEFDMTRMCIVLLIVSDLPANRWGFSRDWNLLDLFDENEE